MEPCWNVCSSLHERTRSGCTPTNYNLLFLIEIEHTYILYHIVLHKIIYIITSVMTIMLQAATYGIPVIAALKQHLIG